MLFKKKYMMCGILVGMIAGIAIGTTNCDIVKDTLKKGKKEFKRLKKSINYMY